MHITGIIDKNHSTTRTRYLKLLGGYVLKVKTLNPDSFICARDLFCAARDAALEAKTIEDALERARTREQVHAQSYGIHSSCGIRDVMQPTDARMQLEERKKDLYEQDMQLIRYCYEVLYGRDKSHGLSELVDFRAVQAIEYKYLHDMKWIAIAALFNAPVITARRMCDYAFDVIDSLGFEKTIAGIGQATLDDYMV